MKTIVKGFLTTLVLTFTISLAFAQKGVEDGSKYGHGEDSINCIKNQSLYREYVKQGNYELAQAPWALVYTECPKSTKYIYIDGIKIIENTIQKTSDPAQKAALIDSMMRIYDQRIKYYGQKGFVLGNKGVDFIKYSEVTVENMQIGYNYLKESITLEKLNSGPAELLTFMQASNALFQANAIEGGQVVQDYAMVSETADAIIANKKKGWDNVEKAKVSIDQVFESSGAAKCENLIPLYTKKFGETPEDVEFLTKSTSMLKATKCIDDPLYYQLSEKLFSLQPSAEIAYELAKLDNQNDRLEQAAIYYKKAIELEIEDEAKAKYYLELGDVTRRLGNYSQAKTYALNSIEFDATSGYPYLLIGNIYAAASKSCSDDDFEQKTVYWVAVDKFIKAKEVDPELTNDANRFIDAYKPHFPDNETLFFHGLKEGDTYTVGCWINERTVVRAR